MWSGNMPGQGDPYPTQWALNPSAQYLHMPHEQVDWASLAQQWIKMKEEAPQPEKEQGEAPMDITKDDSIPPAPAPPTVTPTQTAVPTNPPAWPTSQIPAGTDAWWSWSQASGTTGAAWAVAGTGYGTVPVTDNSIAPVAPTYSYTAAPTVSATAAPAEYVPPPPNVSGYWANDVRIPVVKDEDSHSWDNRNHKKHHVPEPTPEIDAAKRKQLPAWIREGLEKMEREKQKKAENERLEKERKEAMIMKAKFEEQSTFNIHGNGYEEPKKSKFESESESEGEEREKISEEVKPRKSRFDVRQPSPPKPVFRTKEQILQAVMTDVRKILTQILMEVTTEEIEKACEEVNLHFRRKAPATTLRKTQALSSLTGKLGLGIYGSDSESEDSSDEKVTNDPDSDEELKDKIEKLKSEFIQTERHIEREVLEQEEREKRQLNRDKRESSEEVDTTQVHSHPNKGPSVDKPSEHRLPPEDSYRLKELSTGPRESASRAISSPRDRHEQKQNSSKDVSSSRASVSSQSSVRKRRRRDSTSSSSSSSSSTSSSSPARRRRHSSRDRRSRGHKRRRHHGRRRHSSSSSSSPHHTKHRRR